MRTRSSHIIFGILDSIACTHLHAGYRGPQASAVAAAPRHEAAIRACGHKLRPTATQRKGAYTLFGRGDAR